MLNLKLRDEFLGAHMPGTAISLRTSDNQGAVQKSPDEMLSITYPTADVQTALKAISTKRSGRPIILMGSRGRGKSHIMAVMHHAVQSAGVVEQWIHGWGDKLDSNDLRTMEITKGFVAISEPVHNHEYPLLWNLLFERHPKGEYYRGQFEAMSQPFPPRTLLEKMFEEQPTCIILDEFQTWYTGLPETDPRTGFKLRQWAFNFIQNLSEIAKDRPQHLIFIISVLNNQNDAFNQVHRMGPVLIDFRGPSAKKDRQQLLLHRLFNNRSNIAETEVAGIADVYASERFRLLHADRSEAERSRIHQEVLDCWPFSPELLNLLEDHILLSEAAQETRDLIRILAQVYRSRGEAVPIITPADFFVDGDSDEVQSLVDAIAVQAGQDRLRQIAQGNLQLVRDSGVPTPNARELISSIWLRSMSPGKHAGGTPAALHLDITRKNAIDDNAFQAEMMLLIGNSVNIHGDEVPDGPLWFGLTENPRSKVRACAKNNKLWLPSAVSVAGQTVYPGKDIEHVRNTLKHIFVPETRQPSSRVIVLGSQWESDPWSEVDDTDKPARWDRPVLLVIPDQMQSGAANLYARLGQWLVKHVPSRRNTIRFLLLSADTQSLFVDEELMYSARCSYLCSREAWGADATYKSLHHEFDRPLRQALNARFTRFAVLRKWDFQQPQNCTFDVEKLTSLGQDIPSAVEDRILNDLFDHTAFRIFVLDRAKDSDFIKSLMDDLVEPPPTSSTESIPFLGETKIYEFVLQIAARGEIVLNVGGTWIGRRSEDTTEEEALFYIRPKAYRTGQELMQIQMGLPGAVGGAAVPGAIGTVTGVTPGGASIPTGSPGGTQPPYPPAVNVGTGTTAEGNSPGSTGTMAVPSPVAKTMKTDEPATGLNLSGSFEKWGVSGTQSIEQARLEFAGLTVQQIKQILQRIPSTFKANLEITWKEGEDQ